MNVIFEDKEIIVVFKPSGVQSEESEKPNMVTCIKQYTKSDSVYTVHRLDKETCGLMVYAKTKNTAASLTKEITSGEFKKEYYAVAEGTTEKGGMLENLLWHDKTKNKTYVVKRERKGVKSARLSYTTLGTAVFEGLPVSLIKINLQTGRTHQIRVQFANIRHPLLGDRKYGGKVNCELALCCTKLSFMHPTLKKIIEFRLPPEKKDAFKCFDY